METQMFTTEKYRARSKEFSELLEGSSDPGQVHKFQGLKDSFDSLADNEEWLSNNFDKIVHSGELPTSPVPSTSTMAGAIKTEDPLGA